jgi:hypothetical protein
MFTNEEKTDDVYFIVKKGSRATGHCCYTKLQARADGDVLFTCQRVPGR